jgi:sulfur carrier protein
MNIYLNGDIQNLSPGMTLDELVATFAQDPRGIAIERNRDIVSKSQWSTTVLVEGDRLEIVQFVGGG